MEIFSVGIYELVIMIGLPVALLYLLVTIYLKDKKIEEREKDK